jgi:hypothetical protein
MSKLTLNIDDLQVESFAVTREAGSTGGTVRAHAQATYGCTAGYAGCAAETIGETCNGLCGETELGFSCVYFTCAPLSCGGIAQSCQSEAACNTFSPCTGDPCQAYTALPCRS